MSRSAKFDSWLAELECDVIQDEFGYEPGEFTVYPAHWYPLYRRGLTPREALQRALDMHACGRVEDECLRSINCARIRHEHEQIEGRGVRAESLQLTAYSSRSA